MRIGQGCNTEMALPDQDALAAAGERDIEGRDRDLAADVRDREAEQEARAVVGEFGLADKWNVPAGGLAQGERKLLDVAVAYALRPKLILLDEPTSGVGTREKSHIMDRIAAVVRSHGISAVIVEHDMDVVFKYSDSIVMMHEGKVLAEGKPDEIMRDERVAAILGRR